MKVLTKKLIVDYKCLLQFCKAIEKSVKDRKFIYFDFDGSKVSFQCEGSVCSVFLEQSVVSDAKPFFAGIEADKFLSSFKKLYEGDVTLKVLSSKVELVKDNINIKFPIVSGRSYGKFIQGVELDDLRKDWLVQNLIDSLNAIEEVGKSNVDKFLGLLFDTNESATKLVKFSQSALCVSASNPMFDVKYRTLIPDIIAVLCKAFSKDVLSFTFSKTKVGLTLNEGVQVCSSIPYDTYPINYIGSLKLIDKVKLIPENCSEYIFKVDELYNAVDLVSTTLGESDSWVNFKIVGKSEESLVWEIYGKSFSGVEVSEKVLSSGSGIVNSFGVNKKRLLKGLSTFSGDVWVYDLSGVSLAVANSSNSKVLLLTKSAN